MEERALPPRSPRADSQDSPAREPASPPEVDGPLASATQRIETVIEAADRAASAIREQARAEADGYVDRAEREADRVTMRRIAVMSDLSDSLFEQVELLRGQVLEMVTVLEDSMRALALTVSDGETGPRGASPARPGEATGASRPPEATGASREDPEAPARGGREGPAGETRTRW